MVLTRTAAAMTDEELRTEVKKVCNAIRTANNTMMIGWGDEVDPQEIKQLKNQYYQLSNIIIEKASLTKEEETGFDNLKHTIDKLSRISSTVSIIRKGFERLKRQEDTEYERNLISRKLDDMRTMASDCPSIEDLLIEMERQFEKMTMKEDNRINDSTSSFKSTSKQHGTATGGDREDNATGDPIIDTRNDDQEQPSTSRQTTNNGQPETNYTIPTGTTYYPYQQYWWDYGNYYSRSGGPKIEAKRLKHYDGDPIGYPVFRQMIKHYLIDNPQIRGNLNKMMEIRDLLPDKHRYILDRVDQFNPDMNEILVTLDKHYGGRSRIIPALKARIRSSSKLPIRPSEREWESMTETVILIRNTLKTTGLETEEFSLISPIMAKIDRIHFTNIGSDEEVTLAQIESYLKHGWNRERTIGSQIDPEDVTSTSQSRKPNVPNGRMRTNIMATASKSKCMFRDGDHLTTDCPLDAEQRRKAIIDHRMCFRCGGTNHQSRDCKRELRCTLCSRSHLSYLCRDYKRTDKSDNTTDTTSTDASQQTVPKQTTTSSNNQSVLLTMNERSILKTMITTINNRKVRILFDDGAGRSFISKRLAELWKLDIFDVEPIRVDTLSNTGPTITGDKCVILNVPTWRGCEEQLCFRLNEKLNNLQFDCLPMSKQEKLRDLGIDFKDEPGTVDILVGLDNINRIQLEQEMRLSDRIVAKRTTLGWLISGISTTINVLSKHDIPRNMLSSNSLDNVKRVQEDINRFPYPTKVKEIRHIKDNHNPADAYTRGVNADQLSNLHRIVIDEKFTGDDVNVMISTIDSSLSSPNYDISNIDLNLKLNYYEWMELIDKQPIGWKETIDSNQNKLTILIKLIQRKLVTDDLRKNTKFVANDILIMMIMNS